MILEKICEKNNQKSFCITISCSFLKSLVKRNATLCATLDMAAFNTDIIDTATDDKKLNMCLIQLRRFNNFTALSQKLSVEQSFDATTHDKNFVFVYFYVFHRRIHCELMTSHQI